MLQSKDIFEHPRKFLTSESFLESYLESFLIFEILQVCIHKFW